jgi:hypothetical protein
MKKKSIYVPSQYLENKKLRKKNEENFRQNRYSYERFDRESERPTHPKGLQLEWHFGNIKER